MKDYIIRESKRKGYTILGFVLNVEDIYKKKMVNMACFLDVVIIQDADIQEIREKRSINRKRRTPCP